MPSHAFSPIPSAARKTHSQIFAALLSDYLLDSVAGHLLPVGILVLIGELILGSRLK